ncbi:trans-aconitate 2-methyltransferase [Motiliproteus sp. MSK22-1]|uniref:class I SAM-dependent methyltransferase n=1 Tax=Motiliproteus sp. MSK22-1 TaxID=1897630 RepID=UPI0009FA13FC|nr:class I SAM-dependent methyltransferase [Motiliproteus sp. MSK22-1]
MKANYDLICEQWKAVRNEMPGKDSELFDFFLNGLPRPSKVLDLGCGSGLPIAKRLTESGFSVVGIDRSEKLLEQARENVPQGEFLTAEIESYDIDTEYSGVVLWDCLFHLPREQHRLILEKVYQTLPKGGLLMLSSGGSDIDQPPFTDFMFGVEFFYDSYTPDILIALCDKIGFTVEKFIVVNKPDGANDKGRIGMILSKGGI